MTMKKNRMTTTRPPLMCCSSTSSTSSILTVLTDDLLIRVVSKLDDSDDIKNLRLVCKDFLRIESIQRKKIRVYRRESLNGLLGKYRSLESVDFSVCPAFDSAAVAGLVFLYGSLKKLVLCRASRVRSAELKAVASCCPYLEEIDLSYCCGVGDREASALSGAKGLRDLKLVKCLGVTDVGLAKIAVGCVNLERLSLKWCLEITDLGIELLVNKCVNLRLLDVSYLKVTWRSFHAISSLKNLEDLSMVACPFLDDEGLHFFKNGNNSLQKIDVTRCDNVSSSGLLAVVEGHSSLQQISASYYFNDLTEPLISKLTGLKNFNSIKLDRACVSTSVLRAVGLNCKNLLEIGLIKCEGVTDEVIKELVSGLGNLKTLDLTCCSAITDAALAAIAESCKKLTCIKLESCEFITEKGLSQLGSCSLLEEVDLTDCIGVNDNGLKYLSKCSELLRLKLGLCSNISDEGLCQIGNSCKKLMELDLYRCAGISDDSLMAISTGCKKLKKLNLCYCSQITDRGLKYVSTLEKLCDLEMRRLTKVSSAGIVAIAAGCKSLVELDLKRCYSINDTGVWALTQYSPNLRQINLSYCSISDMGLRMVMANMKCLQDAKLVHLAQVSVEGFEMALRASCERLKKVKLLNSLKYLLSKELLLMLQSGGCQVRWVDKDFLFG
ncbi:hypothetical protein Scep_008969 [Stephania cephalantha]|uniref:F-box/LRR-repeat protein 15-like leucin rich repeat domain-containing protein n=1 Tax=Stephania cephalantha TaxID=152367 RepID=A0AAP0JSA7_9MAGN